MIELIIKMVLCLLIALALGFIIGWLISKSIHAKKYLLNLDKLKNDLLDRDDKLNLVKREDHDKKTMLVKLGNKNKDLNTLLEDQAKLLSVNSLELTNLKQSLNVAQNIVKENFSAKEHNQALVQQVNGLEKLYAKKNSELRELEEVVVKAENKVEETYGLLADKAEEMKLQSIADRKGIDEIKELKNSLLQKDNSLKELEKKVELLILKDNETQNSIILYQKSIADLEEELKILDLEGEEDEFIISKDQFIHIEEQLLDYQKEIEVLKSENELLRSKSREVKALTERVEASELDDTSIVKLFRDTYKKITKS